MWSIVGGISGGERWSC